MDKYTVIKSIGEGTYGAALLARGVDDQCNYVLKVIKKVGLKSEEIDAARQEALVWKCWF